jgi:hypothetical protein
MINWLKGSHSFIPTQQINLPSVSLGKLKAGIFGNLQTVEYIKKLAHANKGQPPVRRMAEDIIMHYQVRDHFYLDEARAIGDFVKQNIRYIKDPDGIEMLRCPMMMINEIRTKGASLGDCDDMALLVCTLLLSIGIRPQLKVVKYSEQSKSFNHIYVIVEESNHFSRPEQLVIDAIIKHEPIGYEVPHSLGKLIQV